MLFVVFFTNLDAFAFKLPKFTDQVVDTHKLRGGVYFIDSMPKGVTGKNLRREAKEIAVKRYGMNKQNGQSLPR